MHEKIDVVLGTIGSILLYLFGKIDTPLIILLIFMTMDYITGMIRASIKHEVSSKTGLIGFIKKLLLLLIVSMGVLLDRLTNADGVIRNFIIFYYLANEGLSILENLGQTGIKFPKRLKEILKQLNKEE